MNLMKDLDLLVEYITQLHQNNGPDPDDFDDILKFVDLVKPEQIAMFREMMLPILTPDTIIGFSYTKPFGYNGDFFIIEKIYQHYVNPDEKYKKWDAFFHCLPAAIAVVNRKKLAIRIFEEYHALSTSAAKKVLILGSGPVSEGYEFLSANPGTLLQFDLLDLDQRAIQYAKNKTKAFRHKLTFFNKNVIRFTPETNFDLIWSAGLFDYFKDKHFVFLLKKYYQHLNEGGEMIIGNFSVENPSRKIMEILGDWFLYHRSEEELVKFALQAGVPENKIEVISEPLGINLFLRVRK
jgi:SAM-dependent methyltransferase